MQHIPLLEEVAIVAMAAVVVAILMHRLRLPSVAGLLVSGALVGPHGLGLISNPEAIEVIAEVGVVLLLFTIGLEFSLDRLESIFRRVALAGILQVFGTLALVAAVGLLVGARPGQAIFYGFVFALSSTAIVLRALSERRELDAPHGRFIVGALIFQDLCVVPMVLLVPLLAGQEHGDSKLDILFALGKAVLVVVGSLGLSRLIVPRVLGWVEASRSRELFMLAVLSLCVGTAWLTSLAGLSLALGAFLGGMVVADTRFSHRAMGDMLPLRSVFVSFFFVSLGMLFNSSILFAEPVLVALVLLGLIVGKGFIATVVALLMSFPPRAAWLAGVGLAQFGEFGFVLMKLGTQSEVLSPAEADHILSAGIISMFLTPILLQLAPHMTAGERLLAPLARALRVRSIDEVEANQEGLADHVVLVGYGVAGRLVSAALRRMGAPQLILELNDDNVRLGREGGDPVYYADATSEEALRHAHVDKARSVIILINDPLAVFRVVDAVRRISHEPTIIIRTHYLADEASLVQLGATTVVAEEVEAGVEVLAHVLRDLDVPRNLIDEEVDRAREYTRGSARTPTVPRNRWSHVTSLSEVKVESVLVVSGSAGAGRSLGGLDLRRKTGALVVALRRGTETQPNPGPDLLIEPGDVVFLLGEPASVRVAIELFGEPEPARAPPD